MQRFIFIGLVAIAVFFGVASAGYVFKECGWRALLLGNGAMYAAYTGMCDQ